MLQPKRTKYRRPHIIKYEGHSKSGTTVAFGEFGLQALEGAWITTRQIEAARIVMSRYTKRGVIFPHGGYIASSVMLLHLEALHISCWEMMYFEK